MNILKFQLPSHPSKSTSEWVRVAMSVNFSVCLRRNSPREQDLCKLFQSCTASLQNTVKFTAKATGHPEVLAVEVSPVSLLGLLFIFSRQGHQHSPRKLFSIKHFNAYQSSQKSLTIASGKHVYQKTLFEKHYTVNFTPKSSVYR